MKMPPSLKGRPINGGVNAVTQGASKLLEKILNPLVPNLRTYVKDEWDFLRKFPGNIAYKANILCCDITSLYTSIPLDLGVKALEFWFEKLSRLIPERFTKSFILDFSVFVLSNNYFEFDDKIYHQVVGTAMGTTFAPPYACLVVGFLEETLLFPTILPSVFDSDTCNLIIEQFYRYMDDGVTLLPEHIKIETFLELLNKMDPSIQFTITKPTFYEKDSEKVQMVNFLAIILYLSESGKISTDVFYKRTNTHDYLDFNSHHPMHVKRNIPYVLAKRIIVFTSDDKTMENHLMDLKNWLIKCNYPLNIIDKGIHNARLQGPAPERNNRKVIPLISTYYSNYHNDNVIEVANSLIKNSKDERVRMAFKDTVFVNALRQPPNLLRTLSNSAFIRQSNSMPAGLYKCTSKRCKICKLYLQECTSFKTANGATWIIKARIDCNSKNVLYWLLCRFCLKVSNTGKTDNFRTRINNHISDCRLGTSTDIFDNHVHNCSSEMPFVEPYFKLYAFMQLNCYANLRNYERKLHLEGHDTINA